MYLKVICLFLQVFILMPSIIGQGFEFPHDLLEFSKKHKLSLSTPTENRFVEIRQIENEFVPFIYAMRSGKAHVDMYVSFSPFDSLHPATANPHIETTRLMTNAATNNEGTLITVLDLGSEYVKENFGADWGKEIYFRPRESISAREHCRMVSVYKNGRGLLTLFFFFDEKTNYLDSYYNWIRFDDL